MYAQAYIDSIIKYLDSLHFNVSMYAQALIDSLLMIVIFLAELSLLSKKLLSVAVEFLVVLL